MNKKFSEDDFEKDESHVDGTNQKKPMLMFDLMEEIKQQIPPKMVEGEASSDDHDEAEDL